MKQGYLSEFFKGIAIKKLSNVEVNAAVSNQHEFNGADGLRRILGEPEDKIIFSTTCIYLNDGNDEPICDNITMTWYDSRRNSTSRSSEWRLYYKPNEVSRLSAVGDTLVICRNQDDSLLMIIAEKDSTIERQILWLFGIGESAGPVFTVKSTLETEQDRLQFASRIILEKIGINIQEENENLLDTMLNLFGGKLPTTSVFSEFSRNTLGDISSLDNPDQALLQWMNQEEILFRTLEKHLIADRLERGFDGDVDNFIQFSLSTINRRKSRAGSAFENHIEHIFKEHNIGYSRTPMVENRKKPDFILPGISFYNDSSFPIDLLTMLGVKTTSKDRWRQVCTEADKIQNKHLLTLEPSISKNQTDEMKSAFVKLVIPEEIKNTYTDEQKAEILNLKDFLNLVSARQTKCGIII